jgi:hypothetical protein
VAVLPWAAAAHPVTALLLAGLAFGVAVEAWKFAPVGRLAIGRSSPVNPNMRTIYIILLALAGGFLAGIAGILLFQRAVGIKYLPIYLAVLSASVALVLQLAVEKLK